jgi:protein-tyrosine phosphatase
MHWTSSINDYDQIIPFLFIGNVHALDHAEKFGFIVNCTENIQFPESCTSCIRVPVKDDPKESEKLIDMLRRFSIMEKINQFISMKIPVLVHCAAGMQRSCAVVACYLMQYYGIAPYTAVSQIKMKRSVAFYGGVNFQRALDAFYANIQKNTLQTYGSKNIKPSNI